ncbi:potassium channel beta subunit family protein [Daejeonella oryzae]|uniref:potassium channel beta subunit family protein n=1 Tax=Daejeonella oryzae TaxID=1122943 RepID=UPI000423BF76|nr:aldo/keto reductase [Daejeonella oryzae]
MEYRRLGKSGLQVSALSLGSWLTFGNQIEDKVAEELMDIAYESGVNFFDNAEGYAGGKSEIVMGKILKKKNWDRSSYIVSSKIYFGAEEKKPNMIGLSRKHLFEGTNNALKRLQLDHLDLLYCHRPDQNTPIEETVWAMHQLVMQGKILYWGTSEWSASEIMQAFYFAEKNHLVPPSMEQPQYNMFWREKMEKEFLLLFRDFGLGTTIWSPLASGLLSGKYNNANPKDTRFNMESIAWLKDRLLVEANLKKVDRLKEISDKLNISLVKLALGWCLKNPNVSTVILGASKTAQLKENLTALEVVPLLDEKIMAKLDSILANKPEFIEV